MEVGYTGTHLDRLHLPEEEKPGQLDWSMRISTGRSQLRLMTGRLWWQLRIITKGHGDKGFSDGWYALNPSHGQEGGEKAPTVHSHPGFKVFRVFRGTKGEWGTFTVGSRQLHDRQQGKQWQVRLADNSNRAGSRVVCSRARGNRGDIGPAQRAMALKHRVENPQLAQSIYELRILGG